MKRLEANCVSYVASSLSLMEEGYYNFQIGSNYWALDKDGQVMVTSDQPSNFTIQFASSTCIIIKASNNKFFVADMGGRLWAGASDAAGATLFHY
uniref:Uncharacterized protein n=2 Tax=Sphaerodactylus townsendi TaxID=933632 RepID=A0ACB8G2F6_9SAUR